jgi:ribosomal protein L12E/L44/L45/RPP1/RPP2
MWRRNEVIEALGRIHTAAAAEAVVSRISDGGARGKCGEALRAMGPVAEKATLPCIKSQDMWTRAEAYKVLKEIGGRASIKEMQSMVKAGVNDRELNEALNAIKLRVAMKGDHSVDVSETAASKTKGKGNEKDDAEEKTDEEPANAMRSWRDASGSFEITASFVQLADNKVTLRKKDGKTIVVPLEKLSKLDRTWVEENGSANNHANPFE